MNRRNRRRIRTVVAMAVSLLLIAGPAAADPAGPTHFRSSITDIVTGDEGLSDVEVEVLGGDAFLVVRATRGTQVQIPGYEGEPYARIEADGTVEVNTRSPARWLNDERFGLPDAELPAQADADAPPRWEPVGMEGEYAWHDHRIHWMSPTLPPSVDTGRDEVQQVTAWTVPLVIDGREVTIEGELDWLPGPSPALPTGALLLTLIAGVGVALRRASWLPGTIAVGAVLTGAVGAAASVGLPTGADIEPALVVLPALAAVMLGAARLWARRDPEQAAWMVPAAALPVAVWGIVQWGALTRPIVPGPIPSEVVLLITAAAFGIAAAAATVIGRQLLAATALDPDVAKDEDVTEDVTSDVAEDHG
jgi:hypothetical protein